MNESLWWHNYKSGQDELIDGWPTHVEDYIPQIQAAQGLYKLYLMKGDTEEEAFIKTMQSVVGSLPERNSQ